MEVASYIEALRAEGDRMVAAVAAVAADTPVPTCPDWVVRDLVRHLGGVHRWATGVVATPHTEAWSVSLDDVVGAWPGDDDLAPWLAEGHAALVAALVAAPADLQCWTFLRAPSPLAMWARRQAHETAVHRVDAELAAGRSLDSLSPWAPAFAADGVDELLGSFVPRRSTALRSDPPTSMVVRCTDTEASGTPGASGDGADPTAWRVEIGPERVTTTPLASGTNGDDEAACCVYGHAPDLYLTLWNRAGTEALGVDGEASVLRLFLDGVHVRWS